ncbi:MAG: hypothetical protein JWM42_4085 [Burkholderia sp.]|nr:hypothetical protein [Burkholderia sp.]
MTLPRTERTMRLGPSLPDFDTLVTLHTSDPEAFEHFRTMLLREAVDAAPSHHRPGLEELLCNIERARQTAATPMEAVIAASRAMMDSVEQLANGWRQARFAAAGWQTAIIIERLRN